MKNSIQVKIISNKLNKVEIELLPEHRIVAVPRRVFKKRVDVGFYEIVNPSVLPTII